MSDNLASEIVKGSIIERPKVIYNVKTKKFVMWFHLELKGQGYKAARSGVAIADSPVGPYRYFGSARPNASVWPINVKPGEKSGTILARDFKGGQMARDMTLFVDDDGTAYEIYTSEENESIQISQLSDSYTRHVGRYVRILAGGENEAPAMFKRNGDYYLITSGETGWAPNAARSFVATNIFGPWKKLGNPVRGTKAQVETTFGGQGTYVLEAPSVPGEEADKYIFIADIWRPKSAIDGRF